MGPSPAPLSWVGLTAALGLAILGSAVGFAILVVVVLLFEFYLGSQRTQPRE